SRSVGRIGVRAGTFTANCDTLRWSISGRGGHAARPHDTLDPIAAAAHLVSALYMHLPRSVDSQDAVVITIGQIAGGESANVIPQNVLLRGTLRTLDAQVRQRALAQIERVTAGIAATTGTTIDMAVEGGIACVRNHADLAEIVRAAGRPVVGAEQI